MMSTIATQPKPRPTSKRLSYSSTSRVMTPIPEHQQPFVATRQQKPKIKAAKREDDIPLALLAYKKGYTTIHPTTVIPEEKRHIQLITVTTGTNRSRESSTSNRSILKQQKNTTDKQHRDRKSNSEIMMTMVAITDKSHKTKKKSNNNNSNRTLSSTSSSSPPSSTSSPPSSQPPSLLRTKPHNDRPDKKQTQPLTKHNELIFTKLKQWFSLHRISNKIKSL